MGSSSRAKWSLWDTLIVCSVAAALAVVLLRNNTHNELLPAASGCYNPPANHNLPVLQVSVEGKMRFGTINTSAKMITDKQGSSLLPDKLVYVSYDGSKMAVQSDEGYPLMFSFGESYRTVSVPSTNGPFVTFVRSRC